MRPAKKDIIKWCKALRSGEYKQTESKLQDDKGHCCLGVACEVFAPDYERDEYGFLLGLIPHVEYAAPKWLHLISANVKRYLGVHLTELNDIRGFTFEEIAEVLESVYVYDYAGLLEGEK